MPGVDDVVVSVTVVVPVVVGVSVVVVVGVPVVVGVVGTAAGLNNAFSPQFCTITLLMLMPPPAFKFL